MRTHRSRIAQAFVVAALMTAGAARAHAQMISPADAQEGARFKAVASAVAKSGYANPAVVGHGTGAYDALFALLATSGGKGVLVVVAEPAGAAPAAPIIIESDRTPADLGVRGVTFGGFLGVDDLIDVAVGHRPFRLETSSQYESRHVVRRQLAKLTAVCEFSGAAESSSSKGIGSVTSTRTVSVGRVTGAATLTFDAVATEETQRRATNDPKGAVDRTTASSRKRYELPAGGACKELSAP